MTGVQVARLLCTEPINSHLMELKIFNVEHGACALATCDNGNRLMIDCGHNATTNWRPGTHLRSLGVTALQQLVTTNYDEDHVSGLPDLLNSVYIEWLLRNPTVGALDLFRLKSETGMGAGIQALSKVVPTFAPSTTPEPHFPSLRWHAFWNPYPAFSTDENDLSLVLHLTMNGTSFLFPGDLERRGWLNMLRTNATFRDYVKNVDVLIAAHHGRDSGICSELFDVYECSPKIVVISDDYHKYDTQKTTQYYASKVTGIQGFRVGGNRSVLTTRSDGDLTFTWRGFKNCVVD